MKVSLRTPTEDLSKPEEVIYMVVSTDTGKYIIRGGKTLDIIKDTGERMQVFPESNNHIQIK